MASNDDQIKALKDAFNLYDRKGSGNIATSSLGDLLRSVGQNPTQLEIQELTVQADPSGTNIISFDTLKKIALRPDGYKPAGTVDQLVDGFKAFDPENTGSISAAELRHVLTSMGEVLSEADVDAFLSTAAVDEGGFINYETFVRDLLSA
ncbi:hypothetical protein BGX27_000886 [Mortierella sp. AM989]|nr:hypothetical protein BGX27_000886 [Mortierella sp. AM989]